MIGSLDISTSALVAHRQWMDVISNNLANQFSLENAQGQYAPYEARQVIFSPGEPGRHSTAGVHVREIRHDPAPGRRVYEPGHQFADNQGYVTYPNVNPVKEQMNAMVALNAYNANLSAVESTKAMLRSSMKLLA